MLEKVKQPLRDLRELFWTARDTVRKLLFVRAKKLQRISMGNHLLYTRLAAHILKANTFTIVDVGANNGWFAHIIYAFDPKAKIVSYEPLLSHEADLQRLAAANSNFTYRLKAVGERKGRQTIHESSTSGLSSIKKQLTGVYEESFKTAIVNEYDVDVVTLDSEFLHEKEKLLIKIDVQGYEMEVLQGAKKLFAKEEIACVIIELCTTPKYHGQALAPEMIALLTSYGFEFFDIFPSYYEKSSGQLTEFDAVFIHKKICQCQ